MKYPLMTARNGGDVIMLSREEKKNKVRVRIALPATLHIRPHLFLKSLPCKAVMGARQRGGSRMVSQFFFISRIRLRMSVIFTGLYSSLAQ